ncbi:hypothetical protein LuPra_01936 [Luteitalea pratensis]|uniref:Uncharacterized protein n=2 Tax=Luteitalea pratensis TaxID=1855912 RepID=A0A143PJG4_LUTPR|nr:hypothetical protein LuPra_01936 [Luteitalea pratensis]
MAVLWLTVAAASAGAQATGPLNTITLPRAPTSSVEVRPLLPAWVAMPPTARILTSDGLEMRPLRNSAVTWENARVGMLVGALTNAGGCARDVRAFLQYTDHRWQPMGDPIESEARISQVQTGGVLPYRFRLKRADDFPVAPSGYILQVVQDGKPVADTLQWVSTARATPTSACVAGALALDAVVTQSRATLGGYRVTGTLTVTAGGPIRPESIAVTALLRDEAGDVLEVLTGVPVVSARDVSSGPIETGQVLQFAISTGIPLGKNVATTTIFTDVLADAQAAPGLPR